MPAVFSVSSFQKTLANIRLLNYTFEFSKFKVLPRNYSLYRMTLFELLKNLIISGASTRDCI
jgi:hypothetical protein